jgi:hypothetical protein
LELELIFQTKTKLHRAAPQSLCLAALELRQWQEILLRQRQTTVSIIKMMPACVLNHQ